MPSFQQQPTPFFLHTTQCRRSDKLESDSRWVLATAVCSKQGPVSRCNKTPALFAADSFRRARMPNTLHTQTLLIRKDLLFYPRIQTRQRIARDRLHRMQCKLQAMEEDAPNLLDCSRHTSQAARLGFLLAASSERKLSTRPNPRTLRASFSEGDRKPGCR